MSELVLDRPEELHQEQSIPDRQRIQRTLLSGESFAGITLEMPAQRRLLRFLLDQPDLPAAPFPLPYLEGLKAAFLEVETDATTESASGGEPEADAEVSTGKVWWLSRIETRSFGGLNSLNGEPFILEVGREGLCVEGYNGRGKTSLVSAILWALTGHRMIPQSGPDEGVNTPHPLYKPAPPEGQAGLAVARRWPPVIAYPRNVPPEDLAELKGKAEVILTFTDEAGTEVNIRRSLSESGEMERPDFSALGIPDIAIQIATVMPNRIPFIGVGTGENEITALVKLLGLEPLGLIADHVSALVHGNSAFMRAPMVKEIDTAEHRYVQALGRADDALQGLAIEGSPTAFLSAVAREDRQKEARRFAGELADQSAQMLNAVAGIIDSSIDLAVETNRKSVAGAIARLQGKFDGDQLPKAAAIDLLEALRQAGSAGQLEPLRRTLADIPAKYAQARKIRERQLADSALRLKALAARLHHDEHGGSERVTHCPLCRNALSGEGGQALAWELEGLRHEAALVEKTFADNCRDLLQEVASAIPEALKAHKNTDLGTDPARGVADAQRGALEANADLGIVAQKARTVAVEQIIHGLRALPVLNAGVACLSDVEPVPGDDDTLRKAFARAGHLLVWAEWWTAAQPVAAAVWKAALGTRDDAQTLLGACAAVNAAVERAKPFEAAAKALEDAATAAAQHDALSRERELKDQIKEALAPLRELRAYVNKEAETALALVSSRAAEIFKGTYGGQALVAPEAVAGQRGQTRFLGALGEHGHRVDARYLANTSWLRALLWSFYLAFRERAIMQFGHNPLPLLVADDPQVSFDSAHAKRWVQHFRDMARAEQAQFIITSHDDRFLKCLRQNDFPARPIMVLGLDLASRKPNLVFDGTALARCWTEFEAARNADCDVERYAQAYIKALREHVEAVLEALLRNAGVLVVDTTVGELLREFNRGNRPDALRQPRVHDLAVELDNQAEFRRTMNAAHHDATLSQLDGKDAEKAHATWKEKLEDKLLIACRELELYQAGIAGFMRGTLGAPAKLIPLRGKDYFLGRPLTVGGRVAAFSNGRVDIEPPESEQKPKRLAPFGAAMATVDSLAPLVRAGDIILAHLHETPFDGDLVVAAAGDRLLLGRLHQDSSQAPVIDLAALSQPVGKPIAPVRIPRENVVMRKLTGVIWRSRLPVGALVMPDDVVELESDDTIGLPAGACLYEVDGISAEPRALDGHTVIAGPWVEGDAIRTLAGRVVIAVCEGEDDGEHYYLKRIQFEGEVAWLVNLNPDHDTLPVRVCLGTAFLPRLIRLAPVIGVLFDGRKR